MSEKSSVIIGAGEIGKSLFHALNIYYNVYLLDKEWSVADHEIGVLHITFPYSEEFVSEVKRYQQLFNPEITVIHSTVKPGTSRELGAVHSPVIGIHPHLQESLTTFTKFLGGARAHEVADYFRRAGMKVYLFDSQETTELMKILDTSFYGMCVEYTKDVKVQCERYGVPFEAWTLWTQNYNRGYEELGYPEFTRPNLVPIMKKIGGHCVLPNTNLLDTKFTKILRDLNE